MIVCSILHITLSLVLCCVACASAGWAGRCPSCAHGWRIVLGGFAPLTIFSVSRAFSHWEIHAGRAPSPFRKVMLFVDNAGADAVLGMLPLARELLCMGADVVLAANSYPAINDITVAELTHVVDAFAVPVCPVIAAARAAATAHARKRVSVGHQATDSRPAAAGDSMHADPGQGGAGSSMHDDVGPGGPKLQLLGTGSGGPCLDLRRISADVAAASRNVDLVIIEGMGRAVHTNLRAKLTCPTLKLAMIKTQRVAERLFQGNLFEF